MLAVIANAQTNLPAASRIGSEFVRRQLVKFTVPTEQPFAIKGPGYAKSFTLFPPLSRRFLSVSAPRLG